LLKLRAAPAFEWRGLEQLISCAHAAQLQALKFGIRNQAKP